MASNSDFTIKQKHGIVFLSTNETAQKVLDFLASFDDVKLFYQVHTTDRLRIIRENDGGGRER